MALFSDYRANPPNHKKKIQRKKKIYREHRSFHREKGVLSKTYPWGQNFHFGENTQRVAQASQPHYYHARDTIFLSYRVNKTVSRTGWVVAHLWILFSGWHCNFYPTTENVCGVISIKIAKFLWNKPGKLVSINRAACGLSSCFDVTAVSS